MLNVPHVGSQTSGMLPAIVSQPPLIGSLREPDSRSAHSNRPRPTLHLDENANETFFVTGDSTVMSQAWTSCFGRVMALSEERRKQWAEQIQDRCLTCGGHYRNLSCQLSRPSRCRKHLRLIWKSRGTNYTFDVLGGYKKYMITSIYA